MLKALTPLLISVLLFFGFVLLGAAMVEVFNEDQPLPETQGVKSKRIESSTF